MTVTVTFSCNGCGAMTYPVRAGTGYGWGVWEIDAIADLAPEGWVAFDPYTKVTYCADCWTEIGESLSRLDGDAEGE